MKDQQQVRMLQKENLQLVHQTTWLGTGVKLVLAGLQWHDLPLGGVLRLR